MSDSCYLKVHQFSAEVSTTVIHFHVLRLKDSFFLWIGTRPVLTQLAIAMHWKREEEEAGTFNSSSSAATLMGDFSDATSQNLAARLAKRTGKQVLISCNLNETDEMKLAVEKAIHTEMDKHPDKF